jgi:hypothetical protein
MMADVADDLGSWEPFTVDKVAAVMGTTDAVWWLSGGQALDRFVGRVTRAHGDIDVSIRRGDLARTAERLGDRLELKIASGGRLYDLDAGPAAESVHGLWARDRGGGGWRVQINLEPVDGDDWVFRRDPRVRRPLREVVHDLEGLPCVNPAVQLLWKAKEPLPKDETDLANVLPLLPPDERAWLQAAIALAHPDCPWRSRIESA